jgi:hypothetical protein
MISKILTVLIALSCIVGAISCGGSSNEKAVCEALINSLYDACDTSDTTDQAILIAAFANVGETFTAQQIASLSKSDAVGECTSGLEDGDVTITDDQKAAYVAAIEAVPTTDCQTAVTLLFGYLDTMP